MTAPRTRGLRTLTGRVTAGVLGITAVSLLLAGSTAWLAARQRVMSEVDHALLRVASNPLPLVVSQRRQPLGRGTSLAFRISNPNHTVLYQDALWPAELNTSTLNDPHKPHTQTLDGVVYRAVIRPLPVDELLERLQQLERKQRRPSPPQRDESDLRDRRNLEPRRGQPPTQHQGTDTGTMNGRGTNDYAGRTPPAWRGLAERAWPPEITTLREGLTPGSTIAIAIDISRPYRDLNNLRRLLLLTGGLALLLAGGVCWWLRRTLLQPVHALARDIAALPASDTNARLPKHPRPPELALIAERLDQLLEQVAAIRAREQRAISATAHELRTPLANLRTRLGFALRAEQPQLDGTEIRALERSITTLSEQTESLLLLARLDNGSQAIAPTAVDWSDQCATWWSQHRQALSQQQTEQAPAKSNPRQSAAKPQQQPPSQLEFVGETTTDLMVDPTLFPLLVNNLLGNAMAHGHGDTIRVGLTLSDQHSIFTVTNRCTLSDGNYPHMFEAWWQADHARSQDGHSGLGLSIVASIVAAHNGTCHAKVRDGHITIALHLPHH